MFNSIKKTDEVDYTTKDVVTSETKGKEEKKGKPYKPIKTFIFYVALFAGVYILFNLCLFNATIPSSSMENTISPGDRICGSRLSYVFSDINRGDIVIFNFEEEGKYLVKRVIGLPGDNISITDGKIFVNGDMLEETYTKGTTLKGNLEDKTMVVPEGKYFLLGDNRENSRDSRYWANPFIDREDIIAKVFFRYFPFNNMGTIE